MREWRFIHTGHRSPAENMAIDEAILIAHSEGRVPPTLRFYGWNPPTLSIGYFQRAEQEIDLPALAARGYGFVRRSTGGRAVLHDKELTYSLVVSESYRGISGSITEAYRTLSMGLLHGFRNLGLEAEMVTPCCKDRPAAGSKRDGSPACFDSPSWYELVVEGRKIAGSAQLRTKGVVLQHGSIPLEMDADALFELLRFPSEPVKERQKQAFIRKAVSINQLLEAKEKETVGIEKVERAFLDGFAGGLDISFVLSGLTAYEEELASRLVKEKYGSPSWNLRR